uniref:Uncharacterized protein rps12 n=1 Tax=Phalaenopsis aphrodite subsp. formosana TaxID=308872 RepID=Q3BAH9_PHAAO|nr:hypothetical protein PhapfoPp093 [Phalaenopsis aphrodite subsp. formosana]AAW82574.1 hypothetical protein [Phalaenopsis aphrodite subsp. formosana]
MKKDTFPFVYSYGNVQYQYYLISIFIFISSFLIINFIRTINLAFVYSEQSELKSFILSRSIKFIIFFLMILRPKDVV